MNRRSFLKILGGSAAAVVAAPIITPAVSAPLYIPPQRLDYGVPTGRILTGASMQTDGVKVLWQQHQRLAERIDPTRTIPMTLLWDEFSPIGWQQFGREKVPAGTTLMVDESTAQRWIARGVAAPSPSAPVELQRQSAQRMAEKKQRQEAEYRSEYSWGLSDTNDPGRAIPYPELLTKPRTDADRAVETALERAQRKARVDAGWDRLFASARRAGWEVES